MRIVLVNKYAKVTGGADRHCLDLAELLRAQGHLVRLLSVQGGEGARFGGAFIHPMVTHETREQIRGPRRLSVASRALWNRSAAAAMRQLILNFNPDVVQAHKLYPQLSVAPVHVAHDAGIPVVQWAHDYEFVAANPEDAAGHSVDLLETAVAYRALNTATFVIRRLTHAPRVARWLVASQFVASIYAEHGIDCEVLELFQIGADSTSPGYEARRGAVFCGRLTESKGVRDVVQMAGDLPDLEITIAGVGPLQNQIDAAARSLPNLRYVGFVDRDAARELVSGARVALVPSRWAEPGGRVALEAMAVGTPVVAYPNGGLAEYVTESGGGMLAAQDATALAAASQRICSDRAVWEALSANAVDGVKRVHSPERYIRRIEAIYADVVAEKLGPTSAHLPLGRS